MTDKINGHIKNGKRAVKTVQASNHDMLHRYEDTGTWEQWRHEAGTERDVSPVRTLAVALLTFYAEHHQSSPLWIEHDDETREIHGAGAWPALSVLQGPDRDAI